MEAEKVYQKKVPRTIQHKRNGTGKGLEIADNRSNGLFQSITDRKVVQMNKSIRIITHNIEKYGRKTPNNIKVGKRKLIRNIIQSEYPDLYVLQEVNNQALFMNQMAPELPQSYYIAAGPTFSSGYYSESYPLVFNSTLIHFAPRVSSPSTHTFNVRNGICRQNTYFEIAVPKGYNLRPAFKRTGNRLFDDNYVAKHQNLKYRKSSMRYNIFRMVTVHTSPSLSIPKQCGEILKFVLESNSQIPTIAAGDFYAQKRAKRFMKVYRSIIKVPNEATNYGRKHEKYQAADMYIIPSPFTSTSAKVVLSSQNGIFKGCDYIDYNIDHTPVLIDICFSCEENNQVTAENFE